MLGAMLLAITTLPARAQSGVGDVVYTVGTVTRDAGGQDWAYLLWQASEPGLISNRVFAVYAKPGDPTNAAPYARRSLVSLQTDARVIEPLLRRAANLGDDLGKLDQDLQQLFANFMPSGSLSRADQLSAVIRGSLNDPRYYQNLVLLARNHAGINLALGFADAELIGAGRTTFEVRAYDPVASQDLAVVGRVTVQAGAPTILPPPGPPVLVPVANPMGDLNLKFRWGTPDNLRRLGLMQFGYNLYRVARDFAASNGWNAVTPPPDPVLASVIATNPWAAKRINRVPITPGKLFTLADAANLTPPTGDTNTSFIMDDDGRGKAGYSNYGFTNGAQYYYYVAARDVLGRDGALSSGLLATVCDRLPPLPPTAVHVLNSYQYDPAGQTSTQQLQVVWNQNLGTNDPVINYWIYRWTSVTQMNALSGDPTNNLIAIVTQLPGVTNNSYLDSGPGSPSTLNAYSETYWYSVRAGDAGACGQNLSAPAGPAFGVLRQRVGPGAGVGSVEINCTRPVVNFLGANPLPLAGGPDSTNYHLLINCTRTDPRFEWAEFYGVAQYNNGFLISTLSNYLGRFYYQGPAAVSTWWTPPRSNGEYQVSMQVGCRAALFNGKVSDFAVPQVPPPNAASYADVEFQALVQSTRVIAGGATSPGDCISHDPGGGGGNGTSNICIHVLPSPGSKEYRLYRRVDNGPLSLLCQGPITNVLSTVDCCDDGPPLNGGTICFYVQLLDESGNPSPMTLIKCVDTEPNTPLPVPVLAKIIPAGTLGSPGMNLSWFCPPYGLERFELAIASLPTQPNTNASQLSTQLLSMATSAPMTFTNEGVSLSQPFFSFLTPRVGPAFGNNGAMFQAPCNIETGKTYFVTVRALGKNSFPGGFSQFQSFFWTLTNPPPESPQVPWPSLGLPSASANFTVQASFLAPTNPPGSLQWNAPSGVGVLVGVGNVGPGTTGGNPIHIQNPPTITAAYDPNSALQTNQLGSNIFPVVMYRYQVPNTNFPATSGDAIQVSPLMEKIAYQSSTSGNITTITIHDPFIGVSTTTLGNAANYLWLWLRDTQPQISGARYQYVLVRFKPNHEIDQLIPASLVDVP
jgi:hypothetical protein